MTYILGQKSLGQLAGIHPDLIKVVKRAIQLSPVDFAVGEGLRTLARQKQLVASGASQTLNSRHLTGHAVDLHAFVGAQLSWDWPLYFKISDAMRQAAIELKIPLEWGGCWGTLMGDYIKPGASSKVSITEKANQDYVALRRKSGKSAFIDGPHFQLPFGHYPK